MAARFVGMRDSQRKHVARINTEESSFGQSGCREAIAHEHTRRRHCKTEPRRRKGRPCAAIREQIVLGKRIRSQWRDFAS